MCINQSCIQKMRYIFAVNGCGLYKWFTISSYLVNIHVTHFV